MRLKIVLLILLIASLNLFYSCSSDNRFEGKWDYETMESYGESWLKNFF